MNKKRLLIGALAVAIVLAGGGLFASNMGFKLNYSLLAASDPGSFNGTNVIALPYNRQSGLDFAQDLINDIGSTNVSNVQEYDEATNGLSVYDGVTGTNFALASGVAYYVKMANNVNYIVVGSHNPSFVVSLDAAGTGSFNGTNFYALPYHSTASTAQDLINDIGSTNVANVQMYDEATNGLIVWDGVTGTNFSLTPGEGYFVKMASTVAYTPSHY